MSLAIPTSVSATLRWVRRGAEREYTLSADDVLTLARAASHEGAPVEGVVYALLQRFAFIYPTFPTLASFVKAYAQPINPRWFRSGDLHLKEMARIRRVYPGPDGAKRLVAEEKKAEARERYAVEPWEHLSTKARDTVIRILGGTVPSFVPGAIHYRASVAPRDVTEAQAELINRRWGGQHGMQLIDAGVGFLPGVNVFFGVKSEGFRVAIDPKAEGPGAESEDSSPSRPCSA